MKFGIILKQIRRPLSRRQPVCDGTPLSSPLGVAPVLAGRPSSPLSLSAARRPPPLSLPAILSMLATLSSRAAAVCTGRACDPCLCRRRRSSGLRPCPRRQGYRGAATTSTSWSPPAVDPLPPCGSCPRRQCGPCALSSPAATVGGERETEEQPRQRLHEAHLQGIRHPDL